MKDPAPESFGDPFVRLSENTSAPSAQQIALVPGAEVPVLALDLPPGLRGQAREQVARRQLLDRVGLQAANIEMRPIFPPRQGDTWSKVLITDAIELDKWKALAGSQCRALLPDYLALPCTSGIWTITGLDNNIIARLGPDDGFSAQTDIALTLLAKQLESAADKPKAILRLNAELSPLSALAKEHDIPVITSLAAVKEFDLPIPKLLGHGELDFDLRRDPQVTRRRVRATVLAWRWPLLFGVIAAGLWAATQIIETQQIMSQTAELNSQTRALVKTHFVPSGPLLDMRIQVTQALTKLRGATGPDGSQENALELFAQAAGILKDAGAITEQVSAVSPQELAVIIKLDSFAAVDKLAETLRASGLVTDVRESRASDGSSLVRTELRLTQATDNGEANQ
ncbi:MAG: type II secretion system protein GspL [Sulfitobacter sp.]